MKRETIEEKGEKGTNWWWYPPDYPVRD